MTLEHVFRRASAVLTALVTVGCGLDVADPEPEVPIEIKLDFCSNETPVWFAVQSTTGAWTIVTPDASGTFTFDATSRIGVVFVRQNGSDYKTDLIFTSNLDLEKLSGLVCVEESGTKQVNGSVTGLSGEEIGLVGMSFSSVFLTPQQSSFTLTQLADRPLDLVASRVDVSGVQQQHATKTVIRRAQNPTSGSTMAAINFDSEGINPGFYTATVSGIGSEQAFLTNNFFSQLETSHTLTFVDAISNGALPFVAIPTSSLVAGDYHDLFVVATTPDGVARGAEQFFRIPADKAFTLGSTMAEPAVSVVGTTPYVRMGVQMAGQLEYSTMVTSDFHQQAAFSAIDVSMSVTASFFGGTPIQWDVQMPNLDGLPGWQNSWGLKTGAIDWTVTAYFGRPQLIFGAKPLDEGELVLFASRSSSANAAQAFRTGREARRPRHFSRLR